MGFGKIIVKIYLKNGFGGLILCVKFDERVNWEKYVKEIGREEDFIIFGEEFDYEFNFFEYEMNREGKGVGEVFNLMNFFMEIYKMGNCFFGGGDVGESEWYWVNVLCRCMNRMI